MQRSQVISIDLGPDEDISFKASDASFEDGFNLFKTKAITGLCMIRVCDQYIALEICENKFADGEELYREFYYMKTTEEIDDVVKKHVEKFISIVEEKQLLEFAISVTTTIKTEHTFKFLFNEHALLKYYWDPSYRILHVEIPKNYDVSPHRHQAEIKFGIPPTAGLPLRLLFNDPNPESGRRIYAYNSRDFHNQVSYCSLHDESQSLLTLVHNRSVGWSSERIRRNNYKQFARENHSGSIFDVEMKPDFVRALEILRNYKFDGHLMIYAKTESLSLICRDENFRSEHEIFKYEHQRFIQTPGRFLYTKKKVEKILKVVWEKKLLKYTIVFGEFLFKFPITLRYEHGSEFHTHVRYHWDNTKRIHFLTVVHSGRSNDDTHMKEIHLNIWKVFLEGLSGFHLIQRTSERATTGLLRQAGNEVYSTKQGMKEEDTGLETVQTLISAIRTDMKDDEEGSPSKKRSQSRSPEKKKTGTSSDKK